MVTVLFMIQLQGMGEPASSPLCRPKDQPSSKVFCPGWSSWISSQHDSLSLLRRSELLSPCSLPVILRIFCLMTVGRLSLHRDQWKRSPRADRACVSNQPRRLSFLPPGRINDVRIALRELIHDRRNVPTFP